MPLTGRTGIARLIPDQACYTFSGRAPVDHATHHKQVYLPVKTQEHPFEGTGCVICELGAVPVACNDHLSLSCLVESAVHEWLTSNDQGEVSNRERICSECVLPMAYARDLCSQPGRGGPGDPEVNGQRAWRGMSGKAGGPETSNLLNLPLLSQTSPGWL